MTHDTAGGGGCPRPALGVSRQRDRQAGEVPDSGDDALGGVRGQRAVEGPL
jgi:hypothetical protein